VFDSKVLFQLRFETIQFLLAAKNPANPRNNFSDADRSRCGR